MGGWLAVWLLSSGEPMQINPQLGAELARYRITSTENFLPEQLFNWNSLFTLKGFITIVIGGFLVGFGTRYAGGCTSGHAIMGLSNLQWPSLVATCCFMAGGILMANVLLPLILSL
jgi:uncharacterized membrane protein YedE/YeeE